MKRFGKKIWWIIALSVAALAVLLVAGWFFGFYLPQKRTQEDFARAMAAYRSAKMEQYRPRWVAKYGEASWQTMTEQGLYAYPKAHAVVLAYLAYTTAYLR